MFFYFFNRNQQVKELRKNAGLTAKELALKLKCDPGKITKIDGMKLKEVPRELKERLIPVLRGDSLDRIPW